MKELKQIIIKKDLLLHLNLLREHVSSYKYINVIPNDKFSKSIVEFINKHFDPSEHCFVFIGGHPPETFPLPQGNNIFLAFHPACLAVSSAVDKVIFHGLYNPALIEYLHQNPKILEKSYWVPWGGDLHEARDTTADNYVRSHFRGIAGNSYTCSVYSQKYGGEGKAFFPFSISFESIPYEKIIATKIPPKSYIQIMVNNSAHPSTLEVLKKLEKFKNENIRVATVLSYGKTEWNEKILELGQQIFKEKFIALTDYIPADRYLKFLARNDIYILNQQRPQGMTTAFTSMLLGQKIFMREEISGYLYNEGYTVYNTSSLLEFSFKELYELTPEIKERNTLLAAKRFNPEYVAQIWRRIFEHRFNH